MRHSKRMLAVVPLTLTMVVGAGVAVLPADQPEDLVEGMPAMPPPPGEQHAWLQQLVGKWSIESEMTPPGMPPIKCTGTDNVRSLDGRWIIGEMSSEMPGMGVMHAVLTLGYDAEGGKYQGTWVDSVTDHLWIYEGTLDPTGKVLTLEAEGPNMMDPAGGTALYRDVIEMKSENHRTLSSFARVEGKWVQFGAANYRKQK